MFIFLTVAVRADLQEEFAQNLSAVCQNRNANQFFEMVSIPLTVILSHGEIVRIKSKEEFSSHLDSIFVDEFVDLCSQFGQNIFNFNSSSFFNFVHLVYEEDFLRINVIDIRSIIQNQRNVFLNFLSSAHFSMAECSTII